VGGSLRVGIVGAGSIGSLVAQHLQQGAVPGAQLSAVLSRRPAGPISVSSVDELIEVSDVIAECAGQAGLADVGPAIVARGRHLLVLSAGALVDDELRHRLVAGPGRMHILAGAIGGLDTLSALQRSGTLIAVHLRTTKAGPSLVRPWMDDATVQRLEAGEPCTVFSGTARRAAQAFPATANVAAVLALNTIGFDDVTVDVLAGRRGEQTEHLVEATSRIGTYMFSLRNWPMESNPLTSALVPWSVLDHIARLVRTR
jgi:aspartate dehydrogenase